MKSFLILSASKHGHTSKIAHHIARRIRDAGDQVVMHTPDVSDVLAVDAYDAVIVGGSIHAGHHQRDLVDWVKHHPITLNQMPSAFFSVSLSAAEDTDESQTAVQKYIDDFADDTGWQPNLTQSFAGALQYLEYDFFTRTLIRLMMHKAGHPTDVSQDFDYTDWDLVDAFADRVRELAHAPAAVR